MTDITTDDFGSGIRKTMTGGETTNILANVLVASQDNTAVFSGSITANATVINFGRVHGALVGVNIAGDNNKLFNKADGAVFGYQAAVASLGDSNIVDNDGIIWGIRDYGVRYTGLTSGQSLDNAGLVFGHLIGVFDDVDSGTGTVVKNTGQIHSDRVAISMNTAAGLITRVTNLGTGVVDGPTAIESDVGRLILTNRGLVDGLIDLNSGIENDVVNNFKTIRGQIQFGQGDDKYNGPTGKVGMVFGEEGADQLRGGTKTDRFDGGTGNDFLLGRGGKDFFYFTTSIGLLVNIDTVSGFTPNQDKIVLDDDIFVGVGAVGALGIGRFHVGGGFTAPAQRINYNPANGVLTYDQNGSAPGGLGPIQFATLPKNLGAIDHLDFQVIA